MEIHTSVAPLRDDLANIYALLFRFFGYGFRLAMSNVGWLATQQFVILVPDPILFAPWPVLLDQCEPCHSEFSHIESNKAAGSTPGGACADFLQIWDSIDCRRTGHLTPLRVQAMELVKKKSQF